MNDTNLQVVKDERDLGISIQDNLKVDQKVAAAVSKANRALGMIRHTFTSRNV